jgi:hypothetical protein
VKNSEEPRLTKMQKFEIARLNRKDIKKAPYNPRTISKHARKKLQANLERNGLVETLVVNKRTGNLVSGHQRISVIDDIEGTDNYMLDVAMVDIDEQHEKELNIILNNRTVAGDWDLDALAGLIRDSELTIENLGYDAAELNFIMQGTELTIPMSDEVKADIDKIQEIKDNRKKYKEEKIKKDETDYYATIVFQNRDEKKRFCEAIELKWKDNEEIRHINGSRLLTYIEKGN